MSENLKPGDTPIIFALSTVNGQPNFQELLPVTGREWPKGTWLTRRREELKEQQMKREILCKPCAKKVRPVVMKPYPGEGATFTPGVLKVDCYCDHCMTELKVGDGAEAMSIYTDRSPYFAWESEYLNDPQ